MTIRTEKQILESFGEQPQTVFIKTYVFESGLWYLAKGLGDIFKQAGHKVMYIPKAKYVPEENLFKRKYIQPTNPADFESENIINISNEKNIETQIRNACVKYNPSTVISFETLMEKSQWVTNIKRNTALKVIDIPMIEWVTPGMLAGNSYNVFDEIWCINDLCFSKFHGYKNASRVEWSFVDKNIFYKTEKQRDSSVVKFLHCASLNKDYSSKNTALVIQAFSQFIVSENPAAKLEITGIISDKESLEIISKFPANINVNSKVLNRQNIADIYRESHCVIAPSSREGLGLSFFESESCGCELITTNYPPMNDLGRKYLCDISHIKNDGKLIPLVYPTTKSILEQIKKIYTDIKSGEANGG